MLHVGDLEFLPSKSPVVMVGTWNHPGFRCRKTLFSYSVIFRGNKKNLNFNLAIQNHPCAKNRLINVCFNSMFFLKKIPICFQLPDIHRKGATDSSWPSQKGKDGKGGKLANPDEYLGCVGKVLA